MSAARKKNTKPKQAASRSKQPAPKPHHPVARVVGGLVCLFLALCVVVTYFGVEATLLRHSLSRALWATAIGSQACS